MVSLELIKRRLYCDPYDFDCNNNWYDWGRWVLLGIIIFCFFAVFFCTFKRNRTRVRRGQQPYYGTGWMVPPSYYQSQQEYSQQPVPQYNAQVGAGDAGYYDQNGNFVTHQPPPGPPPGHGAGAGAGAPAGNDYQPPANPPPPQNADQYYNQASGSNTHGNDVEMGHYPPPSYPPPAFQKN